MKNGSKYSLKNASNYLNKLKYKYLNQSPEDTPLFQQNKTFMDEESLELDQHKQISLQNKSVQANKTNSKKKDEAVEEFSEIKVVEK